MPLTKTAEQAFVEFPSLAYADLLSLLRTFSQYKVVSHLKYQVLNKTDVGQGMAKMHDRVHYQVPYGLLGRTVAGGLVNARLQEIFDYRGKKMVEIFNKQ